MYVEDNILMNCCLELLTMG